MAGPTAPLTWHVFQSEPTPTLAGEPAPGQRHRIWPPGLSLSVLLDRFTSARAVVLPAVVEQMRQHSTPKELDLWHRHQPRRPTLATGGGERSRPGMTTAGTQPPPGVQDHDGKDGARTRW